MKLKHILHTYIHMTQSMVNNYYVCIVHGLVHSFWCQYLVIFGKIKNHRMLLLLRSSKTD